MNSHDVAPAETDALGDAAPQADAERRTGDEQAIGSEELKTHEERRGIFTMAGLLRGQNVEARNVAAGGILANNDVAMSRAFARTIVAGHDASLEKGGSGIVLAGENVTIRQGGAQAIVAAGTVQMEQAGSGFAIARRIRIGRGGLTIFAVSGSIEVAEGGKVLVGRRLSAAILATLAAGIGLMVAALIGRRRRRTS